MQRFIAIQYGARHDYAVPEILERAGMLERFYTDICGSVGMGRAASWLRRLPLFGRTFERLHCRRVSRPVAEKTQTFVLPAVRRAFGAWWRSDAVDAKYRFEIRQAQKIGQAMAAAGFGRATHLYSMLGEGGPCLAEAKRCGMTVVSEVYIMLSTERILDKERQAFPDWEPGRPNYESLQREIVPDNFLLSCSDFFVCPSEAVRDDLTANWGVTPARTVVVPYGVSPEWLKTAPRPVQGRVLFAGTAELRKGIHYIGMAAEQLKSRGNSYEFRIAGNVTDRIAQRPECQSLTFLGRIPRAQMQREFEQADIFVLPSLAEGSAESTYEALASGRPVITTASAGSVIRHDVEGLIVPERNPAALATAIAQVVENRAVREQMSTAARERAADFTWDQYGARLIAALQQF